MKRKDKLSMLFYLFYAKRYLIIFVFLFICKGVFAQMTLSFDDNNLNAVKWIGDIQNFKINTSGQLQLTAPAAGESTIFTKFKVPKDSILLDLYFKLQFAPSNDNFSKIYLFTDQPNESASNGYYMRLGENGSNDAIQIYKLTSGVSALLGSGKLGAIASDPADGRVQIKIYRDGFWMTTTDYTGNKVYEEDFEIFDNGFALQDSMFFGIYCKYTATRTDKFFYDDITYKTIQRDTIPPKVLISEVLENDQLKLVFSEAPTPASINNVGNYVASNALGSPISTIYNATRPNEVILQFGTQQIKSGINYTLTIKNILDKNGNATDQFITFLFAEKPSKNDLIITEVLTDPYVGGEDFVEIYNPTSKYLKLDSLLISNSQRNETRAIRTDLILLPGKYVAISKNTAFLKTTYNTPDSATFIEATIPAFNVSSANISILSRRNGQNISIDSFDYDEAFHFSLIDDTKGVSLERISFEQNTNDRNNWHSASATTKFATPGYKNSNSINKNTAVNENEFMVLDKKVFTPNGDGDLDFVLLQFQLEKAGYLAKIKLFDADGFPVIELGQNILLGADASIKWDGTDAEGNIVKTGMYIILCQLLHPDGDIKEIKKVVVAAQKF
jgi:hypothetical protein